MTSATTYVSTEDGTFIVRDLISGATATARTLAEAQAELRRLTSHMAHRTHPAHTHTREDAA